jgi:signal transduction histidine kinase/ActR/RegA family two-component response regulator
MTLCDATARVAVLAPTSRDEGTCEILSRSGVECVAVRTVEELCARLDQGAAAVLLDEEEVAHGEGEPLRTWLSQQEPWSDLPIVVFAAAGAAASARSPALDLLSDQAHVTLLDRPVRLVTLLSAVAAAVRVRRHQYRMRDLLARLADSVRTRDQFLAMLGHELRNPLAAIHTATELLLRCPSEPERPASVIARQTRKLARMVDDLLEVSRVESGKIALQRTVVDLRAIVERSADAMEARAERAGLCLEAVLSPEPVPVDGDPVRLEQIAGNLLGNAVKYTPAGGLVTIAAERAGGAAVLRVTDTGVGIAPELLDLIFEPFAQAVTTLDRSQGGLGLGLALVRGLVGLHGGTVRARSEGPGRGTELEVRLPLAAPAAEERLATAWLAPGSAPAHGGEAEGGGARRHVLVVEDNADNRDTLVMLLESFGHEVVTAVDGPSGVQVAAQARPDVAIVDIGLPGFDGYEVARRLRDLLGERVTLVALTGYGQAEDRARAHSAGFDVHLTKPADVATVAEVVAHAGHPVRAAFRP